MTRLQVMWLRLSTKIMNPWTIVSFKLLPWTRCFLTISDCADSCWCSHVAGVYDLRSYVYRLVEACRCPSLGKVKRRGEGFKRTPERKGRSFGGDICSLSEIADMNPIRSREGPMFVNIRHRLFTSCGFTIVVSSWRMWSCMHLSVDRVRVNALRSV